MSSNKNAAGIYHFVDPIKNFKIRVKLERLNSNTLLPTLPRIQLEEDLARILNLDGNRADKPKVDKKDIARVFDQTKSSEYEEVLIGWQQKLFNRKEFRLYGENADPSRSALEQKYFQEIERMKTEGKQAKRLFTYIEGDETNHLDELDFFVTDSTEEQPNPVAVGMSFIRKRRAPPSRIGLKEKFQYSKGGIVNKKPTDEDIRNSRMASNPRQTMYIMADLSSEIDSTTAQFINDNGPMIERVLCKIQVFSTGTIVVEPDFNQGKTAYITETGALTNEVFHYFIENGSINISEDDLVKERTIFHEFYSRQRNQLAQTVGNLFEETPSKVLRLCLIGEIVSARNFEYDNLYVHYCLDAGKNWEVNRAMVFSGYTHTATAMEDEETGEEVIYYSHPFEFEIFYTPSEESADQELPRMPKIYFQVASQDSWGRHRTAGYTYFDVPSQPGFYDENLSCWRPRGDSIFNELRAFFIGGSHELEDLSYVAIPKQFDSGEEKIPLSRFGFRTISTGTLNVRVNVVFQSETLMFERQKGRPVDLSRHGFNAFMANITAVIEAFQAAKVRARDVQESTFRLLSPEVPTSDGYDD